VARAESQRVVEAFLAAARGGDLATLLSLLAPDAFMRADLLGQKMGTDPVYDGAAAVAARFNGVRGAAPVTIDGELGAAWIQAGSTQVAFVFHVEAGLVREVELIADPDVLGTMDIVRVRSKSKG
jgi:RNA polymerase sigma-70 factor (ECF subfamily)